VIPLTDLVLNNTVFLSVLNSELSEITIRNWGSYSKSLKHGFYNYKKSGYIGLISGSQLAIFISNPQKREGWIKRIVIPIHRLSPCAEYFRIRILLGDEVSGPTDVIYFSEKLISPKQLNRISWFEIGDSKTLFPIQGCFISFEVISEHPGCDLSLQTAISSTMGYSTISTWSNYRDLRWTKSTLIPHNQKTLTPRISVEVSYPKDIDIK
jgi:hypothetical protein